MYGLAPAKKFVLDVLFPTQCARCGDEGVLLCDACQALLRFIPPSCFVCKKLVPPAGSAPAGRTCAPCHKKSDLFTFLSPFLYDNPPIRALIHDLKYRRIRASAPILAGLLVRSIHYFGTALPRHALIVPIPLSPARERVRGFNQSLLIAEDMGNALDIPVRSDILKKIKTTKPQMELRREERVKNLACAFAVSDSNAVRNRTIILLDDVKTTGTTLESAAKTLKAAGATRIWAITIAH